MMMRRPRQTAVKKKRAVKVDENEKNERFTVAV